MRLSFTTLLFVLCVGVLSDDNASDAAATPFTVPGPAVSMPDDLKDKWATFVKDGGAAVYYALDSGALNADRLAHDFKSGTVKAGSDIIPYYFGGSDLSNGAHPDGAPPPAGSTGDNGAVPPSPPAAPNAASAAAGSPHKDSTQRPASSAGAPPTPSAAAAAPVAPTAPAHKTKGKSDASPSGFKSAVKAEGHKKQIDADGSSTVVSEISSTAVAAGPTDEPQKHKKHSAASHRIAPITSLALLVILLAIANS